MLAFENIEHVDGSPFTSNGIAEDSKTGANMIHAACWIAASPSTKNCEGKRDPEMRSSKKGNQRYFGMKAHGGVDAKSGLVHTRGDDGLCLRRQGDAPPDP